MKLYFTALTTLILSSTAVSDERVTTIHNPSPSFKARVNFSNAKPFPMPSISTPTLATTTRQVGESNTGTPGYSPGSLGSGMLKTKKLNRKHMPAVDAKSDGVSRAAFGTSEHPYATSRVDSHNGTKWLSRYHPYRQSGKLYFTKGSSTYVCSASLIKPGVLVTAAHCVAGFGTNSFYSNFRFQPARFDSSMLYGNWDWVTAVAPTSYLDGTATCAVSGIICKNDVAVIILESKVDGLGSSYELGDKIGYYGYGWNGYGFSNSPAPFSNRGKGAQITQLGYPVSHDSGLKMQRNDSYGYKDGQLSLNTVIGSRMTGGSSGGPWLANFGRIATLSGGVSIGSEAEANTVVGVTSWGYVSNTIKQQGASSFSSSNIVPLVDSACSTAPNKC